MKIPPRIVPCRNVHLQYLCDRMRPDEIENYLALTGAEKYDPEIAAKGLMNTSGIKMTLLGTDGLPIICGGAEPIIPGSFAGWAVGSMDGWAKHWISITRATLWLLDELFVGGARRVEIQSIVSRGAALDWYERLGFVCDGIRRKHGAGGQDVAIYARTA